MSGHSSPAHAALAEHAPRLCRFGHALVGPERIDHHVPVAAHAGAQGVDLRQRFGHVAGRENLGRRHAVGDEATQRFDALRNRRAADAGEISRARGGQDSPPAWR